MVVAPLGGRLVVMDSRLLHEVLPAQADRLAVTVWFSRSPPLSQSPPAPVSAAAEDAAAAAAAARAEDEVAAAALLEAAAISSKAPEQQGQQGRHQQTAQQVPLPVPCLQPQAASSALEMGAISAPGRIFVSVPAYRDSEARWTLADLFAKAATPERVCSVGRVRWGGMLGGELGRSLLPLDAQ